MTTTNQPSGQDDSEEALSAVMRWNASLVAMATYISLASGLLAGHFGPSLLAGLPLPIEISAETAIAAVCLFCLMGMTAMAFLSLDEWKQINEVV